MSLSDRERRLLAEMEEALATDDPRLQSALAGSTMTPTKPRLLLGAGLVFLGIVFALVGLLMLIRSVGAPAVNGATRSKGARKSLSARLEERWDRRNFS
jgi:hypothetical protein